MDKFANLDYDTQWLLFFLRHKETIAIERSLKTQNQGVIRGWNYEPFFSEFCNATKNSMKFDDYDKKMLRLSEITDQLVKEGIFEQQQRKGDYTLRISHRGIAYFELEIENQLLHILPNTDFKEKWASFIKNKDGSGTALKNYQLTGRKDQIKTQILLKVKQSLEIASRASISTLPALIMQDPDLTKNIIEFISKLMSGN